MAHSTDPWSALERELDAWADAGRRATLWWRDDDCVAPTASLERLLAVARAASAPLALAVVPAPAVPALAERLTAEGAAEGGCALTVLQHGYAHANHAPAGRKKQELDPGRPLQAMLDELAQGAASLAALFDGVRDGAVPAPRLAVLVPPWNRMDPRLLPLLAGIGFRGLSADGPRALAEPAAGLRQANTHVDLLRGLRKEGSVAPAQVLGDLAGHLAARREGRVDPAEPSGLLTHHLVHDAAAWGLLEDLLATLAGHPAARFLDAAEVFGPAPAAARAADPAGGAAA